MITLSANENLIHIDYNGQEIGIVTVIETPETLEPHAEWHETATKRGIYEAFLEVIQVLKRIKTVVIMSASTFCRFFDAFAKRGIVRKVGFLEVSSDTIHIYQASKL